MAHIVNKSVPISLCQLCNGMTEQLGETKFKCIECNRINYPGK